ncbi:hypothetical protein PR202_ga22037 [Eleusine coracana subsp. coracana]|uniref:Uncharacterized protein n=1 Tax=Eleusine coracana subsp. coracana TaxID=191504 RepID=A0AAV5D175_ELECO|nr:hypothetical protein PR202_ga22037 [Eleusine coracana subsp. coracana]
MTSSASYDRSRTCLTQVLTTSHLIRLQSAVLRKDFIISSSSLMNTVSLCTIRHCSASSLMAFSTLFTRASTTVLEIPTARSAISLSLSLSLLCLLLIWKLPLGTAIAQICVYAASGDRIIIGGLAV